MEILVRWAGIVITMEIFLARTQGFCAGVASAVTIVEMALKQYGSPPLYVYHDIVHNTYVVDDLRRRGVVFVEDIEDVPDGSRIIFSAHGIPPEVIVKARRQRLKYLDATCPLVTKVHKEALKFSDKDYETVLIGHRGHQELIGTSGYVDPRLLHIIENGSDIDALDIDPAKEVAYLTQTTLSVDEAKRLIDRLKSKFPRLIAPPRSDICFATQNRQDAVKELAEFCDVIVICGSPNSSNSNRLRETGAKEGVPSYIIDRAGELDMTLLEKAGKIGISSGASVPEGIVEELVQRIQSVFMVTAVHRFDNPEKNIVFKLPDLLQLT
jgi:4-hydroxy-3-methylbut-2-enyl diphosphate reductase